MKNKSFNFKVVSLVAVVCLLLSALSGFILYRNSLDSTAYKSISTKSLPKVKLLGEILASFRQIRIEVRSMAISGNSEEDIETFIKDSKKEVGNFQVLLKEFESTIDSEFEQKDFDKLNASWQDFLAFGGDMLSLAENRSVEGNLEKLYHDVRVICPIKAGNFTTILNKIIADEQKAASNLVQATVASSQNTFFTALVAIAVVSFLSVLFGVLFARKITASLVDGLTSLIHNSENIDSKSAHIKDASASLSNAVTDQAASLQQTVASVDEISAMVAKNADNANVSVTKAKTATDMASVGKRKVSDMRSSIQAIASGNDDVIKEIRQSNDDIQNIVKIIEEISEKTQVINDIVFQTKLLSFNASVEAARAGEHGKGFAVVAEEVGNLAAMSGKAATEINQMLVNSIGDVNAIIQKSKNTMEKVSVESKEKVGRGLTLAEECDGALSNVLEEINAVNKMILEIAEASSEQSTGVREINKAMSDLDSLTQGNSSIANQTSTSAGDLKQEADDLKSIADHLQDLILGSSKQSVPVKARPQKNLELINGGNTKTNSKKTHKELTPKTPDFTVPAADDARFVEL